MRISITYGAVLLVCFATLGIVRSTVVASSSRPLTVSNMTQCGFNPDGYFYLKDSAAEGFEALDYIELQTNKQSVARPPADSRLYTRDGKAYKFTKLTRSGTHSSGWGIVFEFETKAIEGVSYKFSGSFVRICNFPEDETDPKRVVAEGRIAKFKDDKEETAAQVLFTYSKSQRPRS